MSPHNKKKPVPASEIVIAAGVDKLLSNRLHHECVGMPKRFIGLSSPTDITRRHYHWWLRDRAKKFITAF